MGNRETLQTTAIPISNYKQNNTEEIPSKEYERLIIGKQHKSRKCQQSNEIGGDSSCYK